MQTQRIINEIEIHYSRYCESNSDQMLYYTTKHLLDFLYSFDIVETILCNLKKEIPFERKKLEDNQLQNGFDILKEIGLNKKQYVSYVLHFLEYTYKSKTMSDFYDEASWINYDNKDYNKKERIRLFKIDVIKPLCDYVIDELRKNVSLLYVLDKYKTRTMRFETPYQTQWIERDVQNNLALYLFDKGYSVHREEDLSNGKPDFLFSDEENNPYVIEVKFIKQEISTSSLYEYTSQLKDYMNKLEYHFGVLFLFTLLDYDFIWHNKPNNMEIRTIYVGAKKPSERKTKTIQFDFDSFR